MSQSPATGGLCLYAADFVQTLKECLKQEQERETTPVDNFSEVSTEEESEMDDSSSSSSSKAKEKNLEVLQSEEENGEETLDFENLRIAEEKYGLCGICFEVAPLVKGFACKEHEYCKECLHYYLTGIIQEGSVESLVCPSKNCNSSYQREVLMKLCHNSVVHRLDRFLSLRALEKMKDVSFCPKCENAVLNDDNNHNYGHCNNCNLCYCLNCQEPWHSGRCYEDNYSNLAHSSSSASQMALKKLNRIKIERMNQELIACTTKRCPQCNISIEKNGGCDHMHCTRCQLHFNWSNAKDDPKRIAYLAKISRQRAKEERYSRKTTSNTIKQKVLQTGQSQRPVQTNASDLNALNKNKELVPCPNCKNLGKKDGRSNHIHCSNCSERFCFECGSRARSTFHFLPPSTCRQHS